MKIKMIDASTKKPLINAKIQLQVKGKDSGFLTMTTDNTGAITLDDKYDGQQITSPTSGGQTIWVTATDNAVLLIPSKQKLTESR